MGDGLCREEEKRMNRVILSEDPIVSIHDQGAGDNVMKESMPNGAEMSFTSGWRATRSCR